MILLQYFQAIRSVLFKFGDYRPHKIGLALFFQWINQFPKEDRSVILKLFNSVIYVNEKDTRDALVMLNTDLLNFVFKESDLTYNNIIYATFSTPASSSHVMLNMLRDAANLERTKATILDLKGTGELYRKTSELGEGIIIYVDDFIGSGKQFSKNRNFASEFIVGNFGEYLLAPVICEEALPKLNDLGVQPVYAHLHTIDERPLHKDNNYLNENEKHKLISICRSINKNQGLGFKKMAAMVVFYRNSPNNMPLVLRGSLGQAPYKGILPRANDF